MILIDDDPTYRAIMRRVAQTQGIELETYESLMDLGSAGLLGRYDAALVDYDLGTLNGIDIAEYLNTHFHEIPVVLVSEKHREPTGKDWPGCIKRFVHKTSGYEYVLSQAQKCLASKGAPERMR
jgi:DNA-binding NtrC family response regulator